MDKELQSEVIRNWAQKDDLGKALVSGMHGMPEFKRDEKENFLGEFRERVIRLLSKQQVAEDAIYPEIIQALQDENAKKMIIDGSIHVSVTEKYRGLAKKENVPYIVRSDPEFKGATGLMVVSNDAVDVPVITVENRSVRLKLLGLSSGLIGAAGKKVCKQCFEKIEEADPNEIINYRLITWMDRLAGEECPAHDEE